jgi:hypothetical protein
MSGGDPSGDAAPKDDGQDEQRRARLGRVTALGLDATTLAAFVEQLEGLDRDALIEGGHLAATAPAKGLEAIGAEHRNPGGEALLELAKDVLYGLLFGDESTQTQFDRVQRSS